MKNVLDKGFVRLIDTMGDDSAIVQAARVSYGKGTKTVNEDRGLIRYLMRHGHTSPFEMVEMKFHIKIPMDAWRQMIRTRTASVNEYSTRYSVAIDDKQTTLPGEWRFQATGNKQGSGNYFPIDIGMEFSTQELELHNYIETIYNNRLALGMAREQARKDLPLSNYTEIYWKIDLHNLFNFLRLRLDLHAQKEIREYAKAITKFVKEKFPISYEAFEDYVLHSVKFSRLELDTLSKMFIGIDFDESLIKEFFTGNKGELREFVEKLHTIIE